MGLKLGNLDISLKVGSADCTVYLGTTLIQSGDTPTPSLPSAYTQVTYVENTGDSSVNLGLQLCATEGNTFNVSLRNTMQYVSGGYHLQTFLVCMQEDGEPYDGFSYRFNYTGQTEIVTNLTNATSAFTTSSGINTASITCSGVTSAETHTYPLVLFSGLDSNRDSYRYCLGRLYEMQVTLNGNLVRNLVPCYRNSDSVVGLYDLVNSTFYTSDTNVPLTCYPTPPQSSCIAESAGTWVNVDDYWNTSQAVYKMNFGGLDLVAQCDGNSHGGGCDLYDENDNWLGSIEAEYDCSTYMASISVYDDQGVEIFTADTLDTVDVCELFGGAVYVKEVPAFDVCTMHDCLEYECLEWDEESGECIEYSDTCIQDICVQEETVYPLSVLIENNA